MIEVKHFEMMIPPTCSSFVCHENNGLDNFLSLIERKGDHKRGCEMARNIEI